MEKKVVAAHPLVDTLATMIILFPLVKMIGNNLNFRWGPSVQVAILAFLFGVVFRRFSIPKVNVTDSKSSKRAQKHDYPPSFWSMIIKLYLRFLSRRTYRRIASMSPHAATLPQIRYINATSVGILIPEPSSLCFFVNGLLWTQLVYFDEKELVILYNLSKNSLYHIKAMGKVTEDVYELTVCTPLDGSDAKFSESLGDAVNLNEHSSAHMSISPDSSISEFQQNNTSIIPMHQVSNLSPPSASIESSNVSPDTSLLSESMSVAPTLEHRDSSSLIPTLSSTASSVRFLNRDLPGDSEKSLLASTELQEHYVTNSAHTSTHISLGDDVILRPRKRFDIYEETLTSAQQLSDTKKSQVRKLRKDSLKKLASIRAEIESTTTKIASKRRSDERTRKRIQALKERVSHHREELEKLSTMENVRQSPEVETLATKADMIQRDFESKKQGFDVSLRVWAESQRTKKLEISKLQQRCAKLSDRAEKHRRDYGDRLNLQTKRINEYIDQIREERNSRKMRRVRLESDFVEAIRKLDVH